MDALSQLFYLSGVGYEYTKYTGEQVFFSEQTRKNALRCCEIDTQNEANVAKLNCELDGATWLNLVPEVSLVSENEPLLKVRIDERQRHAVFSLKVNSLDISVNLTSLENLNVVGEYRLNDIRYIELVIPLPALTVGYHDAQIKVGEQCALTQIWCVPEQVHQDENKKRLGLSLQLYTLKNKAGLGVGDFSDLLTLVDYCADYNMDYILLNPLHLLFADMPERASPYSPNSRALLNPLYINIDLSEDSKHNAKLSECLDSPSVTSLQNSHEQFIDYEKVTDIKYRLFNILFEQFTASASVARRQAFRSFCEQNQTTLATMKSTASEFDYYLQWQAHIQLTACQTRCKEKGMAIGLINDLAVGCSGDGCEFNSQRDLYAKDANVGAPPDPWAEGGQNWGLPALNPLKLNKDRYQFYKALIRANMQGVGGLRIDHVMALRRLWWCFETDSHQDGCYIYYPFEHLMAILKIESKLNRCIVIGEDLGVVPPEVKHALGEGGIFSNSLFYFEKDEHGEFVNINDLNPHCLLMIANHDVPPFTGWWEEQDISIKYQYSLINDDERRDLLQQRLQEKHRLLRFINNTQQSELTLESAAMAVYSQLAICLARASSRLFALQLDDLDEQHYPVNIPGTNTEYPNWRRVLNNSCEVIFNKNASLLAAIDSIRNV
jgi:4-alpha-glucanotransferase